MTRCPCQGVPYEFPSKRFIFNGVLTKNKNRTPSVYHNAFSVMYTSSRGGRYIVFTHIRYTTLVRIINNDLT